MTKRIKKSEPKHKPAPDGTLRISPEILSKASREHTGDCLAGTAIFEQIPGAWSINVTLKRMRWNVGEETFAYPWPPTALIKAAQWEEEDPSLPTKVKPFSIKLRDGIIKPVQRYPDRPKRKAGSDYNRRQPGGPRQCVRRFHFQPVMRMEDGSFVAVLPGDNKVRD